MSETSIERRLVKSPPELWQELSDPGSLAKHLGEFGEIRITRVTPESRVLWEGERASGSVELVASGWGTKVTLTARVNPAGPSAPDAAAPGPADADVANAEPVEPEPPEPDAHASEWDRQEPVTFQWPAAAPAAAHPEQSTADTPPEAAPRSEPEPGPEPAPTSESTHHVEPGPTTATEPAPTGSGFLGRFFGRRRDPASASGFDSALAELTPRAQEPEAAGAPDRTAPAASAPPEPPPEPAQPTPEPSHPAQEAPEPREPASEPPEPSVEPDAVPAELVAAPAPQPEKSEIAADSSSVDPEAVLTRVLDDLGAAHHRPFSR